MRFERYAHSNHTVQICDEPILQVWRDVEAFTDADEAREYINTPQFLEKHRFHHVRIKHFDWFTCVK